MYATGFDAMTGPVVAVDIRGRDGVSLREKWADGPSTYLGLTTVGFPNFFTITGPGSPSVLSNMAVSIEQHVDWVAGCLDDLRARGFETIEPTPLAEAGWNQHVDDGAVDHPLPDGQLLVHGGERARASRGSSCPTSPASTPTAPRATRSWPGTTSASPSPDPPGSHCNDGVIRRLQLDVAMLIKT